MMPAIHQLVAGFTNGDAITNESRVLRSIFLSWNCRSDIFCEHRRILPELRGEARDISDLPSCVAPHDVALLHLSIGSSVNDAFAGLPCRKAILYHNITPSHYFELVQKQIANNLDWGRRQMASLAGVAEINMAVSAYNAGELSSAGYGDVRILPLLIDFDRLDATPDRTTLRRFDDDLINILFVGRCAPNKRIEDAIEAFRWFHKYVEPNSRFIHVGSFAGTERYYYLLLTQAKESDLSNIHFAGAVRQSELNAFYRCSHIFLCMSEHEGFCIPILESMACGLPVMAYDAAAVPDTMGGAGILFREKRYDWIAEMMARVVRDRALRDAVIRDQQERVARYRQRDLAAELRKHLQPLLG